MTWTAPPSASDGALILNDVEAWLARFVAYPSEHERVAHALWIAHTHCMEAWESTPRIAFLSPEPASGKSRALEVTAPVVPNPVEAISVTPAFLFRRVAAGGCTILFDEVDTVFGPRTREQNEDLRALLNAGHRRGAKVGRCVVRGKEISAEEWPAYAPVALAGLGDLPDTVMTRSIVVRMRRRSPDEHVEPYRLREHEPQGHRLRRQLAAWIVTVKEALAAARPAMPDGVTDRDADVWEPLLAIADAAGGEWPKRARAAAVALVAAAKERPASLGIRLLADIKTIFDSRDADAMSTADLIDALCGLEEAPWSEIAGGKPMNARGLANRLKAYGIASRNVRAGTAIVKGYRREDFADAWKRYLPPLPAENATSATAATAQQSREFSSATPDGQSATSATGNATPASAGNGGDTAKSGISQPDFGADGFAPDGHVAHVADVADSWEKGGEAPTCIDCGVTLRSGETYRCAACREAAWAALEQRAWQA